jgi:sulfur carrier protein
MNITINGKRTILKGETTIEDIISSVAGSTRGSAAVIDGEVLPRSTWRHTRLREGQNVDIVTAVQGG